MRTLTGGPDSIPEMFLRIKKYFFKIPKRKVEIVNLVFTFIFSCLYYKAPGPRPLEVRSSFGIHEVMCCGQKNVYARVTVSPVPVGFLAKGHLP